MTRPAVSVVVPFAGDGDDAAVLLASLAKLDVGGSDEVAIVDNSTAPTAALAATGTAFRIVPAPGERSSYYARNVGAEATSREWILFLDADCRPMPGILDRYFAEDVPPECGALIGSIRTAPEQAAFLARWARWREILGERHSLEHPYRPFGSTANLLVRRVALEEAGGFIEGIRSGGDADFCWRLQDLGWSLEHRSSAAITHRQRERLGPLIRQAARYGRGRAWLERRFPDCPRPRVVRDVARALGAIPYHALRGRLERSGFRALDALFQSVMSLARLLPNRAPGSPAIAPSPATILIDRFPDERVSQRSARIEARRRPPSVAAKQTRGRPIAWAEDDSAAERWAALARLTARHPVRALRGGRGSAGHAPVAVRAARAGGHLVPADGPGVELARAIAELTGLGVEARR